MTKGEYRVGISFNPSGNADVDRIKRLAADLIDAIDTLEVKTVDDMHYQAEVGRCKATAMTNVEQGVMWAVKAATKPTVGNVEADPGPVKS